MAVTGEQELQDQIVSLRVDYAKVATRKDSLQDLIAYLRADLTKANIDGRCRRDKFESMRAELTEAGEAMRRLLSVAQLEELRRDILVAAFFGA